MKFPIGFVSKCDDVESSLSSSAQSAGDVPVKSLVEVSFLSSKVQLTYFNDQFDLHIGNIVFVDGKYEGVPGRVVNISKHFKIKLEDYKRVISVADTEVKGQFFHANSHFITFERAAIPFEKVSSWVLSPEEGEIEYSIGLDDAGFPLDDLGKLGVSSQMFERGLGYYKENKVQYLSIDNTAGKAIVTGTTPYVVEFEYRNGQISNLYCDCPYMGTCKHEVATMLQLREWQVSEFCVSENRQRWRNRI